MLLVIKYKHIIVYIKLPFQVGCLFSFVNISVLLFTLCQKAFVVCSSFQTFY